MVIWSALAASLHKNPHLSFSLVAIEAIEPVFEKFKLPKFETIEPLRFVIEKPETVAAAKPETVAVAKPAPVATDSQNEEEEEIILPPPPMITPKKVEPVIPSHPVQPAKYTLPKETNIEVDPIIVGIELEEPLYKDAPQNTRAATEREAAARYEACFNEIYKAEGGRNRGWIKGKMEALLKPRVASGGNIRELDRAKAAFTWSLAIEDKALSSFLDFICLAKRIRIAMWCDKIVHIYPAADRHDTEDEIPLYHVSEKGKLMNGPRNGEMLYKIADVHKLTVMPCLSVIYALSRLTIDELEKVGLGLGMATVEGKKNERVAAIAAYKLRKRLYP